MRESLVQELINKSIEKPEYYLENCHWYFSQLQNSSAKIQGKTIKSIYHPYVLSWEEYEWIKEKTEYLWGILEKTAKLLLREKEVASFFEFPDSFTALLEVDPGYSTAIPITRFDAFYNMGNIYFCEFNTDGTSGMNETNTMEECFLNTELGKVLQEKYSLQQFELRQSLLDTLLENWRQFRKEHKTAPCIPDSKPNIAIVDFLDKATIAEFEALKNVFRSRGYDTMTCDPRDLTYQNGCLWHDSFRIDLVYRRAVTTELLERYELIEDFLEAYRKSAFCMVGSFRSEAAHSKLVFTFLTSQKAKSYFTSEEINFIKTHLPATFRLASKGTAALDRENLDEIIMDKNRYIIKPHNAYGSQGLYMGKDCSQTEWEKHLKENMDTNYIVQQLIKVPEGSFVTAPGTTERLKINLSPYLYGGKLRGFYTRVSNIDIITTARGGSLIPTFVAGINNKQLLPASF
ncbi:MAG: hypothetical protein AB1420_16160 [Bacillota bacterium]